MCVRCDVREKMVNHCVVCKKQAACDESSRSYHKFPSKHEPRQAWLKALNLSKCSSHSKICSDHFDPSCFHDTGGYTTRKRLKNNAVPRICITAEDSIPNLCELNKDVSDNNDADGEKIVSSNENFSEPTSESTSVNVRKESLLDDENCLMEDNESNSMGSEPSVTKSSANGGNINPSSQKKNLKRKLVERDFSSLVDSDTENDGTDNNGTHTEQFVDSNDGGNNRKRKNPVFDPAVIPEKRIRLRIKKKFMDFARKDFESDEKWEFFKQYVRHKGRVVQAERMKSARRDKKIVNLNQLVDKLKSENMDAIAEYLQVERSDHYLSKYLN